MAKTYNILHIISGLGPYGTERQMVRNLEALDSTKFVNFVFYFYPYHELSGELSNLGIKSICFNLKGKKYWPFAIYRLMKLIKEMQIDIVHTNLFEADIIGGIAARLAGVPAISTLASPADSTTRFSNELNLNKYKVNLAQFMLKIVYKLCHSHFIGVSEHVRDSWADNFGIDKEKITVIHRGINQSFADLDQVSIDDSVRSELSLDGSYPILVNVGRMIPHKGQKYLLQAMPMIIERFPKAKLFIAGEGSLRTELNGIKEDLSLNNAVTFLGTYKDVKKLLLAGDIFIFPSLSEGMPGALLEAAALGKPCVASNIGPVRELVKDGQSGMLVTPGSPQDLAQAVIMLSSDKERAHSLGKHIRDTAINNFLIESNIKKLETVYLNLIQNKQS